MKLLPILIVLVLLTIPVSAKVTVEKSTAGDILVKDNGKVVSTITEKEYQHQLDGNYLYLAGRGFQIWDLSNPSEPERLYDLGWGGSSFDMIYSFTVKGGYAYLGFEGQLEILDVSTPELSEPTAVVWTEEPILSMKLTGNTLVTNLANYDVSDKSNPVRITNIDVADVGVYQSSTDTWLINTEIGVKPTEWKATGTTPILGDWDGFYAKNIGLYNPTNGVYTIRFYDGGTRAFSMSKNSIPFSGDWHGIGIDQPATYNPKTYVWELSQFYEDKNTYVQFGWKNCIPLTGDWNGDGIEDIGVYNDDGDNFVLKTGDKYEIIGLGWDGVVPVIGDWNGDGKDDVGVYSKDTWVLETTTPNKYDFVGFGWGKVKPIVGDWNKDGKDDVGVFNPDNGMFVLGGFKQPKMVNVGIGTPLY